MTDTSGTITLHKTLQDVGEFRLIQDVIKPMLADVSALGLGDDCGYLPVQDPGNVVISTDVTPLPLAWHLGERSFETWGWYSGLINASDLASAGVRALALCNSVEAPGDMHVSELKDFFSGLAAFCRTFSIRSAGGNIRDGQRFACHATAVGFSSRGKVLGRSGCKPGDIIVSVGTCGEFISAFLKAQRNGFHSLSESEQAVLLRPRPQLFEMQSLNESSLISAASDNSDGVLGAIWNIAEASTCAIELDMRNDLVPDSIAEEARTAGANPWNLMFFWGDWQVIAAVPKDKYERFVTETAAKAICYRKLGLAHEGPPVIWGSSQNGRCQLRVLRNEAFRPRSFDTNPLDHIVNMLHTSVFLDK